MASSPPNRRDVAIAVQRGSMAHGCALRSSGGGPRSALLKTKGFGLFHRRDPTEEVMGHSYFIAMVLVVTLAIPALASAPFEQFEGTWRNMDPNTPGITTMT